MASSGRIAGIDYGTVRIGISITDPAQHIASPYENYTRRDLAQDAKRFKRLVDEEGVVLFVVGLPLHANGDESQKSEEARRFGQWLQAETGVETVFFDERHTSADAEEILIGVDMTRKKRRQRLDMLAAQLILKGFLEHRDQP